MNRVAAGSAGRRDSKGTFTYERYIFKDPLARHVFGWQLCARLKQGSYNRGVQFFAQ